MTMRVRGFLLLVAGLAMMGLAGCGHYTCGAGFGSSTCTSSGPPSIGGGGNGASGTVYAYLLSEVGASDGMAADTLSLSANSWAEANSFAAPSLPLTTTLDGGTVVVNLATQKYLYIPFHNGTVYGYAIDGTSGALTTVANGVTVLGGTSIAANPAGTFLFVSDFGTGDISVFNINQTDGSLSAVNGSPFPSGILAGQIATDGLGKYLYVTSGLGGTQVAALAINQSTGALSTVIGSPFPFSMSKVLGENSGAYLLGISGLDSHLYVFGINSQTGAIAEIGSPTLTLAIPVDLAVSPNGTFVYTFDGLSLPMEGYEIQSSGTLMAVSGSPFIGVNLETGKFDQSGLYLFGIAEGQVAEDFGPYGANTSTGVISPPTFTTLGFPGGGFAVSDLNDAP
jgi:hypothetical protein